MVTRLDQFMAKVAVQPDGCWLWTAAIKPNGYGHFRLWREKGGGYAHRWAYEHFRGPVPTGLDLDHLCRVRACVNPEHLEPVTRAENCRRGDGYRRDKPCVHGHPAERRYISPSGAISYCRDCKRTRQAAA